jgi:cobalamin biosynthesis Mg chelatase CobN
MRTISKKPAPHRGAPTIRLTLRGMFGAPSRSGRRSARSFFALPLVLALFALAAIPAFANAGAIPEYELEENEINVPQHETVHKPKPKQHVEPEKESHKKAEGSNAGTESSAGESEEPSEEEPSEESEEAKSQADGGHHEGGGNKPGGEGGKSKGQGNGSSSKIGEKKKVASPTATPVANTSNEGSGSSPLVPILIVVVVLAAISIGVVLYRQRKGGSDGADRRVSSGAR